MNSGEYLVAVVIMFIFFGALLEMVVVATTPKALTYEERTARIMGCSGKIKILNGDWVCEEDITMKRRCDNTLGMEWDVWQKECMEASE